jgi:hypothetical protein
MVILLLLLLLLSNLLQLWLRESAILQPPSSTKPRTYSPGPEVGLKKHRGLVMAVLLMPMYMAMDRCSSWACSCACDTGCSPPKLLSRYIRLPLLLLLLVRLQEWQTCCMMLLYRRPWLLLLLVDSASARLVPGLDLGEVHCASVDTCRSALALSAWRQQDCCDST